MNKNGKIENFLDELGISVSDNDFDKLTYSYTLTLNSSDDYAQIYSILDNSKLVDLDEHSMKMTEDSSLINFLGDEVDVKIEANYSDDIYKINFMEKK